MDIRSGIAMILGGTRSARTAVEIAAQAERCEADHAAAEAARDAAQVALDELLADADLGNPVASAAIERARKALDRAQGDERTLRVVRGRLRRQESATLAAEREAVYRAWRESIGPQDAAQADKLLTDALGKLDAAGRAVLALLAHVEGTVRRARRGRDVAGNSGIAALPGAVHASLMVALAEATGGAFPAGLEALRYAVASQAPIRERVQEAYRLLAVRAGEYDGPLQGDPN